MRKLAFGISLVMAWLPSLVAQVPRPLLHDPQAPAGSTAADGYAPIPEWLGQTRAPRPQKVAAYDVETAVSGIKGGWSFHFLPDGRILLTERAAGNMRIADKNGQLSEPIAGLPPRLSMFEALPDKNFAKNRVIYFGYSGKQESQPSEPPRRSPGVHMVARARLSEDDRTLEDVKILLNTEGIQGRLIQARDGTLFITSGIPSGVGIDSVAWPQPQDLSSDMGKLLHINADGSIPPDNPFVGRADARPEIYALGFREDQGIAIHPRTGRVWVSENGPKGGDEINIIEKGANYGFPIIGYGREYSGKPINGDKTSQEGMKQPVYFWTPSIALSGMTFYTGKLFPEWQGDLFVAAMAGKHVARLVLHGDRVIGEERLLVDLNTRTRDVHEGPDGALYVLTDGINGKILRLVPKN